MHVQEIKQLGSCPGPIVYHCSTTVDNNMYLFLGMKPLGKNHTEVHIFDMEKLKWKSVKPTGKPPSPRCLSACAAVGNKIYVFGGYQVHTDGPHTVFNGMYVFDTEELKWDHLECTGLSPDPRAACCMVYYNDNLWIFGGSQGKQVFFGDLFKFDLSRREWAAVETFGAKDKPKRLCCHAGTLVGNRMYIFGGLTADEDYKNQRVTSELYSIDLDMFTWRKEIQSGAVPHGRCCHSMISAHNLIFVAGGGDLLSRTRYDNHIYMCNTSSGNKWTRLTSYFGAHLPKCVGLTGAYDDHYHKLYFFGGKTADNEMLGGLYELPLNKSIEIMDELKHQELEEKRFSKILKDLKKKKAIKDDEELAERDRLQIRFAHQRTRSNSLSAPTLKHARNITIKTGQMLPQPSEGSSSERTREAKLLKFDSESEDTPIEKKINEFDHVPQKRNISIRRASQQHTAI